MTDANGFTEIDFGGPATYRIVVQGAISERWVGRFSGMSVYASEPVRGVVFTTLTGTIQDQAALSGVLETLYGLHMPILKLEKVEEEP
jgi:hypothetical protein